MISRLLEKNVFKLILFSSFLLGATWEPGRVRRLAGRGTIEYCSFDTTASGLIILCHSNYSFVEDSISPITVPKPKEKVEEKKSPKYTYMQNDGEIID